jgi:hypothetical protein
MAYLVCKKCAGYYELREGESPKDFDKCQCGGSLRYVETINVKKFGLSSKNMIRISGVLFGASIILIPYYLFSPIPSSASFVLNHIDSFILWSTGGFAAALIAGGKIINGASNGLYSAIISGLIVIIIFYLLLVNSFNNPSFTDNIAFFAALSVIYILIPAIFSIIGGLIGISIRKGLNKLI